MSNLSGVGRVCIEDLLVQEFLHGVLVHSWLLVTVLGLAGFFSQVFEQPVAVLLHEFYDGFSAEAAIVVGIVVVHGLVHNLVNFFLELDA